MTTASEHVAIVGMAGRFPGSGADLDLFWNNIHDARDCSREVPLGRWYVPPERCFDPRVQHPDSVYSTRGYFLDPFVADVAGLDIPHDLLAALDPLFHLVLDVGNRAWQSAKTASVNRRNVGIILGNICLPTDKANDLAREYLGEPYGVRTQVPTHPLNRHPAGLPASLLAKSLKLGSGVFTLDAACASSLYAIKLATDELLAGRADAMLAGGCSRPDPQYTQMGFSQLRALSTSGKCSPFDSHADGLVVGEGAGIFVLKRLSDAVKHGDTIHAVITGAGLSNDMVGNLLAPALEGQLRAMKDAYRRANWLPTDVELIECHATGTPVGDAVEFESLRELWRTFDDWKAGQCVIGSVKSTVGHLLTGAGAAATMKVLLAMRAGKLPPQANFATPGENLKYQGSPFRVLSHAAEWRPQAKTRRAAVSGFGFGGVNAHLLLEEWKGQEYAGKRPTKPNPTTGENVILSKLRSIQQRMSKEWEDEDRVTDPQEPIAIVGMAVQCGPWNNLREFQEHVLGGTSGSYPPPQPSPSRGEGEKPHLPLEGGGRRASRRVGVNEDNDGVAGDYPTHHPSPARGEGVRAIDSIRIPLDRFRIPPKELEELLPQQLLILKTAAAALDDVPLYNEPNENGDPRTGVFVGLGLDLNTTNFHVRWAAKESQESFAELAGPALNANRVMGALGSIAASRIARAFRFGGPSFTICSEDTSAASALEVAIHALRLGELDRAVVGGVELLTDPRATITTPSDATATDAAVAIVLKRLSKAEKDGDRIYAVIRGVGSAIGGEVENREPNAAAYASSFMRACLDATCDPSQLGYLETTANAEEVRALAALLSETKRSYPLAVGTVRQQVGHTGFASALVGLVKTALAVYQNILPGNSSKSASAIPQTDWASSPRYWLHNRSEGPRRAAVSTGSIDGSSFHAILEEYVPTTVSPRIVNEKQQPLGARSEAIFVVDGNSPADLADGLGRLFGWLPSAEHDIELLARQWYQRVAPDVTRRLAITLVPRSLLELKEQIEYAIRHMTSRAESPLPDPRSPELRASIRDRVFFNPYPLGRGGKVAYVYPGSGNQFAGMGRDLAAAWPSILERQHRENQNLRSQFAPHFFWQNELAEDATPRDFLFGQVTLGTLTSDLMRSFEIPVDAMIGQSLGESAGLFGLRVWTSRDEMYRRIQTSTLFTSDLGPPYNAARTHFGSSEDVDWAIGITPASPDDVRSHFRPGLRAYLLIVTTPNECVIGGIREDMQKLASAIGQPFIPIEGVTLAHCEAGKPVEAAYRELHKLPVSVPQNVKFLSGAWGRVYKMTEDNAADSITAGLLNTIDFPNVVETAYREGTRVFLEMGPGASASRMIDAILGDRPHLARSVCVPRQDSVSLVLRTLANLIAERVTVNIESLYDGESLCASHVAKVEKPRKVLTISTRLPMRSPTERDAAAISDVPKVATTPAPAMPLKITPDVPVDEVLLPWEPPAEPVEVDEALAPLTQTPPPPEVPVAVPAFDWSPFIDVANENQQSTAVAHELFLRLQSSMMEVATAATMMQVRLVANLSPSPFKGEGHPLSPSPLKGEGWGGGDGDRGKQTGFASPQGGREQEVALSFEQCTTFAIGKIADALGEDFAEVDSYPTRVRLPEGPLMLVDRILKIEGEAKSMKSGRVVTDHTVHANRWYLDAGRCPTSITVEAGQADLFLSGYLGIDFQTKGLAVYRLLDAVVMFHRELPRVGERIEYDIHIDEFFNQADAWLFRFRFEGTVNGQPLLSMKNGVAGFFTQAALAAGQGIVHTKLDKQPIAGKKPADWKYLVSLQRIAVDEEGIEALRRGDLVTPFGAEFRRAKLQSPMRLPTGMLRLVDRVTDLDPTGGRFGCGFVRAEYEIQPKEWFIECHFIDDKVMPGTLMYECCLHTLRILLMRIGWVGEEGEVVCEPVPGIDSRLKCRGQVLETTKLVTYEVSIKELGFGPAPFCIGDALMYADGKPIVEITNLSLRMSGLTREKLNEIWTTGERRDVSPPVVTATTRANTPSPSSPVVTATPTGGLTSRRSPVAYPSARIMAYSNGKPSEAFGEPYRIFDSDRIIARLPGPPYQFLDCITKVTGEPFVLKAGASCEALYDVPPDAWYFAANRCPLMPFSILLEIALQPCGWLAAYCGSALTSPVDLSFRNLGGKATQFLAITPDIGRLTTNVKMTSVSSSVGMIIQHYTMLVTCERGKVYEGTTYFGFFAKEALENQVGMPNAEVPYLTSPDISLTNFEFGYLPHNPPFPDSQMRMIDEIEGYLPKGGKHRLGQIQGRIKVDPNAWFFQAHFYQDPVWPGSLGLESFLQLLKFVAWKKFGNPPENGWQTVAMNRVHTWTYRGQVLPKDSTVTVVLEVTEEDSEKRRLTADGFLIVDGRIIYQMVGFTLE